MSLPRERTDERWYEFTQREVISRPFYVRARTVAEAREKARRHDGVPDWAPDNPDSIRVGGRARLADQETAQDIADERGYE